jgi:hypothetical protein
VGYAALTLTEGIIPKLDTGKKAEWARDAHSLRLRVEGLPILTIVGKFFAQDTAELISQLDTVDDADKGELHTALSAAGTPTEEALYYAQNPFEAQADGQRVGFVYEAEVRHVVGSEDFFNLTHNVVDGGLMGWGNNGTYQEVKDAAVRIDTALNP